MSWPAGQMIAGKPYRQMKTAEFGQAGAVIAAAGNLDLAPFPWWAGGYGRAALTFGFSLAVGGDVQLQAFILDSDGQAIPGTPRWEIMNGITGENFPAGQHYVNLAWDDGILPGNYAVIQVLPGAPKSMRLNPIWNKAAFIGFVVANNTAGNLTITDFNLLLAGA